MTDSLRFTSSTQRLFEASVAGSVGAAFSAGQSGSALSGAQKVLEESAVGRVGSAMAALQASSAQVGWQKSIAAAQGPLAVAGAGAGWARSFERALEAAGTLRTFETMQASRAHLSKQALGMLTAFDAFAASRVHTAEQLQVGIASWKNGVDWTSLQSLALQQSAFRADLGSVVSGLAGIRDWRDSIGKSLFETVGRAVRASERLGQRIYFAVLEAQGAVLAGDEDAVEAFFVEWTDLPRTQRRARVLAGSEALLEVDFEQWDPADGFELIEHVESVANRLFRRGRRPLTETKLKYSSVVSLESVREVVGNDVVDGKMPVSPSAEDRVLMMLGQFDSELAMTLLAGLPPEEAQIAMTYGFTVSWNDAARICGFPASKGELVRAKLKRREQRLLTVAASWKRGR